MLLGKSKLGNFIQYLGNIYPTKYHVQLPNERFKKVGHMILGKSMLGKFCPTIWSLLPNLLGKKVMNIHRLIHVRARGPHINLIGL